MKTFTIDYSGKKITAKAGEVLRDTLIEHNLKPHNDKSTYLNCRGMGTCGTCAVEIEGSVHSKTKTEQVRLDFAPHDKNNGLRLACQVKVNDNLKVTKHKGFWGQLKPKDKN